MNKYTGLCIGGSADKQIRSCAHEMMLVPVPNGIPRPVKATPEITVVVMCQTEIYRWQDWFGNGVWIYEKIDKADVVKTLLTAYAHSGIKP